LSHIFDLFNRVEKAGVRLELTGDHLKINVLTGGDLPPELLAELKERKEEIIAFLLQQVDDQAIPVHEKREYYPLSSTQKRLYILQQLDPQATVYNVPHFISLEKDIDKGRLSGALDQLLARHEALRTSFISLDGEPVQRVYDQAAFELELFRAAGQGGQGPERSTAAIPGKQMNAPLGRVPILSSALNLQRLSMLNRIAESPQFVKPQAKLSTVLAGSEGEADERSFGSRSNCSLCLNFAEARCESSAPAMLLYRTGDLCRWLADGNIEFLGRLDFQVKIRGFRIEPGEIESQLMNHPGIKEAAVLVRTDGAGEKYLCAYIVPVDPGPGVIDHASLAAGWRDFLSEKLPAYMVPAHFVCLDRLPLTANGKIDRLALPEPGKKAGQNYVAPRDTIEEWLVSRWSKILGIQSEEIGIDDDFFRLGGHSLKATTLMSRIRGEFHLELPLVEIFKTPTIRKLASIIQSLDRLDRKNEGTQDDLEEFTL